MYQRLVTAGKSKAFARSNAERLLPEGSRHMVVTFLFYFSFGFAALLLAGSLHAGLDLSTRQSCVPAEFTETYRGYNEVDTQWFFSDADMSQKYSGYSTEESCQRELDRVDIKERQSLAGWLSATLVALPLAAVTGVWLTRIDRRERYARVYSYRYVLNNILLVCSSVVAVVRLLAYLAGLIEQLLGVDTGPDAVAELAHVATTVVISTVVLAYGIVAHRKWAAVWNAAEGVSDE